MRAAAWGVKVSRRGLRCGGEGSSWEDVSYGLNVGKDEGADAARGAVGRVGRWCRGRGQVGVRELNPGV